MSDQPVIDVAVATSEHIDAIARIGSTSFRDAYGQWSKPESLASHIDAYFSTAAVRRVMEFGQANYVVARVDGVPGGFALYRDADCPSGASYAGAMELWQLYVGTDAQRLGLGRHLVDAVVSAAAERDANGVWLSVWQDADWALSFYAKCGFEKVGIAEFGIADEVFMDDILWRAPD